MLQNLSAEIRLCYWRAEDCARRAGTARTETARTDYVRHQQSWLRLARSYEFQQRIELVIDQTGRRKTAGAQGLGQVNFDGPTAATAWLKLPETSQPCEGPKPLQKNELVAIVDDDEYARAGLCALVESLGHRAATFASAEDYLTSGMSESAACLILDVHLPGMSGPDLQAHLMAAGRCPPTIFATGRFEEHVRKRVIGAGALDYLTKPSSEKALLDCIDRVFAKAA